MTIQRGCIHDKYALMDLLGEGGFSKVYFAESLENPDIQVAVKVIDKSESEMTQKKIELISREIEIMAEVDHRRMVKLYEVLECDEEICLVMQLAKGGELYDRLVAEGRFGEDDAKVILFQLLEAISELHSMGVVHRDIKPENILFLENSEDSPIVLADFGLSDYSIDLQNQTNLSGTPAYIAPEVILETESSSAQDLWGCGLILFIMLSGYHPFFRRDENDTLDAVVEGNYSLRKDLSEEVQDLMSKLLCTDPSLRITAEDAVHHPWFSEVKPCSSQADYFHDFVSRWISYVWRE